MNVENESPLIKYLKKILPQKILSTNSFYLFIILKLLPLILITHDWNIVKAPNRGLSSYLFEFTIGPLLHREKNNTLYIVLLVFLLALCAYSTFIIIYTFCTELKNTKKIYFTIALYILYIIPFFLNQHTNPVAVYIDKMVLFYWKVDKTNSEMKKLLYNTIIY